MANYNFKDELGNRYGRLVVVERAENSSGGGAHWRCLCDCGTERVVKGNHLRRGLIQSCGCLQREVAADMVGKAQAAHTLPPGTALFNQLYDKYRRRAKVSFELTKEDFSFLTKMNCHYCGIKPSQVISRDGDYVYNGVDRIDSSKGYTMDNVVPCCGVCNKMKMDMDYPTFIGHTKRIASHRG